MRILYALQLSRIHHKEDKEMKKLFHINIQVKNTKVYAQFDYGSQVNLIAYDLARNIGLEFHDHPSPYPFEWVNMDVEIKVTK
jgi:hypothetical protein